MLKHFEEHNQKKDSFPEDSVISKRKIEFKSYDDLVTSDNRLKKEIEDKFLGETPTDLNIDYSQYENFINFSSAQVRLENFKKKIEEIEKYTHFSSSLVVFLFSNKLLIH